MKFAVALIAAACSGCASNDYRMYAEAQANIAAQRAAADQARYAALAQIAAQGDSAAKVAAVMSLNMGSQAQAAQPSIAPPKSTGETLLQWASLILPTATQMYSVARQTQVAMVQSNNSSRVSIAQSADGAATQGVIVKGFVDVASKVQGNSTTTSTTSTTTTTTPTQVLTQEKIVLVDKPIVTLVDKPLIVEPKIITVDKPLIVNQPVIVPVPVPVPTPTPAASAPGG